MKQTATMEQQIIRNKNRKKKHKYKQIKTLKMKEQKNIHGTHLTTEKQKKKHK